MNRCLPVLLLLPTLAPAGPRVSANYTLSPETSASGVPQAASLNYSINQATDPSSGVVTTSANYTHRPGFIGQLYDVAALAATAANPSVPEGASNALGAAAVMDDDTTLPLDPTEVAWSVAGGPLSAVDASGIAQTVNVFADASASVQADYRTFSTTAEFTVENIANDDVGLVAGDGIRDAWQFDNFDDDADGTLDPDEAARAAPDADPDHDTDNNFVEWATGYNPNDGTSRFSAILVDVSGSDATFELSQIISGTTYILEAEPGLGIVLPFAEVPGLRFTASTNSPQFQIVDPSTPPGRQFWRLSFERSPEAQDDNLE